MRREKNPDTICYDQCKGTGVRKDVLTVPFSLCWIQYIEFENNKKKKTQNQVRTMERVENEEDKVMLLRKRQAAVRKIVDGGQSRGARRRDDWLYSAAAAAPGAERHL